MRSASPEMTEKITTRIAAGCLLAASLAAGLVITIAWQCQWSGPFRDYWEVMPLIESTFTLPLREWPWHELWAPYGGAHRLVIPKLLFIADFHITGGSNRLILATSILCLLVATGCIIARVRQCYPADRLMLWLASTISLLTLFSATQLFNLNYSYDTQWFQVTCFSVLALFLATHPALSRQYWRYSSAALLAGSLASLGNMAGFLVWPPLGWLLWIAAHNRRQKGIVLFVTLTACTTYLYGIGQASESGLPTTPLELFGWVIGSIALFVRYLPMYLGSPFTQLAPWIAGTITAIATLAILYRGWKARHRQAPDCHLQLLLSAIAAQAVLVAMATAWGRRYYSIDMAMADRYQAIAMLFWMAVGISTLLWLQQRNQRALLLLPTVLLAGALAYFQVNAAQSALYLSSNVRQGHLGAAMGLTDMHVAMNTLSFPAIKNQHNYLAWHNPFLQQRQLAYFRNPALAQLGTRLPGGSMAASDCTFTITGHTALDTGAAELNGLWQCADSAGLILLVDAHRQVVGILEKPPAQWLLDRPWGGYALTAQTTLTPVALTRNGQWLSGMPVAIP